MMDRIICKYTQGNPGPLLICLAGIHGNEHAGITALKRLDSMLLREREKNPGFVFSGTLVGLIGNIQAVEKKTRFLDSDLNRIFINEIVNEVINIESEQLTGEKRELKELLDSINQIILDANPSKIILLDIHTTSAEGGLFAIPSDDPESINLALALHAPVIKGFIKGLKGTTLHYFSNNQVANQRKVIPIVFEAGQHLDPLSINRCISAIINCLRTMECVKAKDVENHHDEILIGFSKGLPKLTKLVDRYKIDPDENFEMKPGFINFQKIKKNQELAINKHGEILSCFDGYILMPLYQKKGEDGFFIVAEDN
jgi:succinylglutamate desuccinylase